MPKTNTIHRPLVSLLLPRPVPALLGVAERMVESMTGNPAFPTPTPTLAAVTQAISDLRTAQAAALSRVHGAATARDDKRAALVKLLQQLKGYIQTVADAATENGASIIESAGVTVKKVPARGPRVFTAKQGAVSGSAKIIAVSAGPRSSYEWELSIDGGKTWTAWPASIQAKTTVTGLPAGTTVLFRYRVVSKSGQGDWVQPVSLLVK